MVKNKEGGTKNRILLAATKVFARKGYKEATVREICELAGTANINSINYYFGSKENLYREILNLMFSSHKKQKKNYTDKDTVMDRLRDHISSYCKMVYGGGEVSRDIDRFAAGRPALFCHINSSIALRHVS